MYVCFSVDVVIQKGSNCILRGSVPILPWKPIATLEIFKGGVQAPVSLLDLGGQQAEENVSKSGSTDTQNRHEWKGCLRGTHVRQATPSGES